MQGLRVALSCLTILPVGVKGARSEKSCGRSLRWFPIVGLLIGVILVGAGTLAAPLVPPATVAAWIIAVWVLVTGGLHLDGFADVCDGLYGGRSPAQRLRIMKDPHIGAVAVVGLFILLLLKWTLVSGLPGAAISRALCLSPCLGRAAMVLLASTLPYAGASTGLAAPFVRGASPKDALIATGIALTASWLLLEWNGVMVGTMVIASALLCRGVFQRALGGVTGDVLGAVGEVTEVLVLGGVVMLVGAR
jgi:adenosylcobinamide-GDP ribazoletransferase